MLPEHEIGKNIRMIRKLKELTLQELAKKTGFTKGYLSKVENSEKAPPVSTLLNIARGMGVSMSELFGEGHEPTSLSLVRKNERQQMARNGTTFGYSYETLAHKYPDKKMEPYILTIPPEIEQSPLFQHQGEELLFVMEGTMKFLHGENEYLMEKGDCIYFDSGIGHRGFALGGREAKILMVILSS
ncbi:MAG: XRE family transcriptional regulator [Proteobacteria bacterium]|nr:XRE family transcriptional regulator [Pseudomonadota bacterium]MBU1903596.1 XRE family transcriptional regulator [Pseudomonadota bacterium]